MENQKKLKRAKIITWIIAITIGAIILSRVGFRIYNNTTVQPGEIVSNSEISPDRTVVEIRCNVEGPEFVWQGSGVLINKDGLVLTNAHVIPPLGYRSPGLDGRKNCLVILPDPDVSPNPDALHHGHLDQYLADPVVLEGTSNDYDLALLRITGPSKDNQGTIYGRWPREFPAIDIRKCDKNFKIGDRLIVYGYPAVSFYDLTATEGVLSTIVDDYTYYTSAKVDAGNSGGLAIDEQGCFVGIPEAITGGVYEQYGVIISAHAVADFLKEFNTNL
jgi:S1-C subfamily serine protease